MISPAASRALTRRAVNSPRRLQRLSWLAGEPAQLRGHAVDQGRAALQPALTEVAQLAVIGVVYCSSHELHEIDAMAQAEQCAAIGSLTGQQLASASAGIREASTVSAQRVLLEEAARDKRALGYMIGGAEG
jgi:hypothetical protein